MRIPLIFLFGFLLFVFPERGGANAPQADNEPDLAISLEEAIQIAMEDNFSVKQAEFETERTQAQYRQSNALFLPQISLEYNVVSTNNPLNAFGTRLQQERVTQQDFQPARLNDPESIENYQASLNISQPLINPDGFYERRAAGKQRNSADEQLKGTRQHMRYQVIKQYYEVVLFEQQLDVVGQALETVQAYSRQANDYYEEGMINEADRLSARVHELDMESEQNEIQNKRDDARQELAYLLGMDGRTTIEPTDALEFQEEPGVMELETGRDIENARIRAMDYRVEAADDMVSSARLRFLPSLNLFGSYNFNDEDFAAFDNSSYMVGASLSWDIFSGYKNIGNTMEARAAFHKAKSMKESARIQQNNQFDQALRNLENARKQIELTEESIRQSEEDVRLRSDRFEQGMENTTDLLQSETKLAESRLKRLQAVYRYNMSVAALEMLLETDL